MQHSFPVRSGIYGQHSCPVQSGHSLMYSSVFPGSVRIYMCGQRDLINSLFLHVVGCIV
jgi:hypothetical protein